MFKQSRSSANYDKQSTWDKRLLRSLIILEVIWLAILGFITIKYFIPLIYTLIKLIKYYAPLISSFMISKVSLITITHLMLYQLPPE